eukprot:1160703-Pelagomonas_calceolata.AAC.12
MPRHLPAAAATSNPPPPIQPAPAGNAQSCAHFQALCATHPPVLRAWPACMHACMHARKGRF